MFIIITGVIIAVGRVVLSNIKDLPEAAVLVVMALVNYIALGFVILFLYNGIKKYCNDKIEKAGIETVIKKKRRYIIGGSSFILLCIYLIVGVLYMKVLKSGVLNDVISIIALAVSIASDGLTEDISPPFYGIVVKLSSIERKNKKE